MSTAIYVEHTGNYNDDAVGYYSCHDFSSQRRWKFKEKRHKGTVEVIQEKWKP